MLRGNKIQIRTLRMPRSFYIEKDDYAEIYPTHRTPRRLPITFNFMTKSVWVDKPVAEYLMNKYNELEYVYPEDAGIEAIKEPELVKEPEPELSPDDKRFAELTAKIKEVKYVRLTGEEKYEYQSLKMRKLQ